MVCYSIFIIYTHVSEKNVRLTYQKYEIHPLEIIKIIFFRATYLLPFCKNCTLVCTSICIVIFIVTGYYEIIFQINDLVEQRSTGTINSRSNTKYVKIWLS